MRPRGCLIAIAATGRSGIYHLSGERLMSYFEFALRLAEALGVARNQVRSVEIGSIKTAEFATGVVLEMPDLLAIPEAVTPEMATDEPEPVVFDVRVT